MSSQLACRSALSHLAPAKPSAKNVAAKTAHPGLLLSRYLRTPVKGESADGGHPPARRGLLKAAIASAKNAAPVYKHAFERWKSRHPRCFSADIEGRMVIGLGTSSPLETGLTMHHTYGVPYIPGSSLKGLAAHYCDLVWGNRDPQHPTSTTDVTGEELRFRHLRNDDVTDETGRTGCYHRTIFGTTEDAGHMTFHDAWLDPGCLTGNGKSGLVLDIMTPHHGDYYSGKQLKPDAGKGRVPPTDFDSPNPIAFLSVTGRFWFSVDSDSSADPLAASLQMLTGDLLQEALREWGIGGKTSSGYGRTKAPADS